MSQCFMIQLSYIIRFCDANQPVAENAEVARRRRTSRSRKHRRQTASERFQTHIRSRVLSGLLVVVPLGITAFVVKLIYDLTAGLIAPVIDTVIGRLPDYGVVLVSVLVFVSSVYILGVIARAVVGKRLIRLMEALLARIPLIKTIYGASKQVLDAVSFKDAKSEFQSVVLVEFPGEGCKTIGLITGTFRINEDDAMYYRVFIPTTPNPTTGFFVVVRDRELQACDLGIEDAMGIVMSGGAVSPERLPVRPFGALSPE